MSKPQYIAYVIENDGNFKSSLFFEAANLRLARATALTRFIEQYPEVDDSKMSFHVFAHRDDLPCGTLDEWSENNFNWDAEEETAVPVLSGGEDAPVDYWKLSPEVRNAVLIIYDRADIVKSLLPDAMTLTQAETGSFDEQVLEALNKTPGVNSMEPDLKVQAINWIRAKCPESAKWPAIKAELINWKKNRDSDRKGDAATTNTVDIVKHESAEQTASSGVDRPRRSYKHDFASLDKELANAFWPGDIDLANLDPAIAVWGYKEVVQKDREDWKRFSMCVRKHPDALKFDKKTIRDLIQLRPTDIHKNPVALKEYVTAFLSEHGVFEDETEQNATESTDALDTTASTAGAVEQKQPDDEAATGPLEDTPPVERTGPFYFLLADGEKFGRANKLTGLQKALADGGKEISQEEYQARKNGTYQTNVDSANRDADLVGKQLAAQRGEYVEGISDPTDPKWVSGKTSTEAPEQNAPETEQAAITARAEQAEKEFSGYTDSTTKENMSIWMQVHKTDPSRTKNKIQYGNKTLPDGSKEILRVTTSINPTYQTERATKLFGPFGIGWGVNIEMERFDNGTPFMEPAYDKNGAFMGKQIIRNADGSILFSLNHTMQISLWYLHNGKKGIVYSYGHTKYMYQTKNGVTCDEEYAKKSLTDATTKALSQLGFSADVYGGLFEDSEYSEQNKLEHELIHATNKADEVVRIREELDERFKANVETMKSAVTPNEVSKIASSLTRKIGEHLKAANATGDADYAKYLNGRLTRLETIKVDCLKALEEKA